MTRGGSSAAERAVSNREVGGDESASPLRTLAPETARPLHTPGRIIAAPLRYGPWALYDQRRGCLGTVGDPDGGNPDITEANARRMVQAWNGFDAMFGLALAIAADTGVPAELRAQADRILLQLAGAQ